MKQEDRECPVCGKHYSADSGRLKFGRQTTCSRSCSYALRGTEKQRGKTHKCYVCGNEFYRAPSHIKTVHGKTCCSIKCARSCHQPGPYKAYVRTAVVDYSRAAKKMWETRRRNNKPYPEAARREASLRAIERIKKGGGVSKFEHAVGTVFRCLGFDINTSVSVRSPDGRFLHVFDIVLPARRLIVECHGSYWHGGRWTWDSPSRVQTKNLIYEERKTKLARELGFDLRLVWEHRFKKDPQGACLEAVR